MSEVTGLRLRATAHLPAHPCSAEAPACDDANGKDKPLKTPAALDAPVQGRYVSLVAAALLILMALVIGVAVGTVGTLQVLCTWNYPRLDEQVHKLITMMGLKVHIQINDEDYETVSSCTPDQPLVERRENVLDDETFEKVQACLIGHPMIKKNHLNPDGFNGTRGFVINFSSEGVDQFLNEDTFNCGDFHPLRPFFEAVRHPETNGFVMNVLVCDKPTTKDTMSVKDHVDDTLAHTKVRFLLLSQRSWNGWLLCFVLTVSHAFLSILSPSPIATAGYFVPRTHGVSHVCLSTAGHAGRPVGTDWQLDKVF